MSNIQGSARQTFLSLHKEACWYAKCKMHNAPCRVDIAHKVSLFCGEVCIYCAGSCLVVPQLEIYGQVPQCMHQRPKNHRGIVALPSGKFLRVQKVFARNPWKCTGKFADRLQNFQIVWIFSGWSGKFPDSLESFRIIWIFSGWSGKFSDSLESLRIIWIFSEWSRTFW